MIGDQNGHHLIIKIFCGCIGPHERVPALNYVIKLNLRYIYHISVGSLWTQPSICVSQGTDTLECWIRHSKHYSKYHNRCALIGVRQPICFWIHSIEFVSHEDHIENKISPLHIYKSVNSIIEYAYMECTCAIWRNLTIRMKTIIFNAILALAWVLAFRSCEVKKIRIE